MLLVDMKHLLDPAVSLGEFENALADLAEAVLETALDLCHSRLVEAQGRPRLADGRVCPMALLGLGKFGGRELGYASDLELLVVYEGPGKTDAQRHRERRVLRTPGAGPRGDPRGPRGRHLPHRPAPAAARQEGPPGQSPGPACASTTAPAAKPTPSSGRPSSSCAPSPETRPWAARSMAVRDAFVWSGEPWDMAEALRLRERQVTRAGARRPLQREAEPGRARGRGVHRPVPPDPARARPRRAAHPAHPGGALRPGRSSGSSPPRSTTPSARATCSGGGRPTPCAWCADKPRTCSCPTRARRSFGSWRVVSDTRDATGRRPPEPSTPTSTATASPCRRCSTAGSGRRSQSVLSRRRINQNRTPYTSLKQRPISGARSLM